MYPCIVLGNNKVFDTIECVFKTFYLPDDGKFLLLHNIVFIVRHLTAKLTDEFLLRAKPVGCLPYFKKVAEHIFLQLNILICQLFLRI